MAEKILDLHIHSKYSRACSPDLVLPTIAKTCEIRGIDMVVTGDFTHPAWLNHIKEQLVEENEGIYRLKDRSSRTKFLVGTEVSSIKTHRGKVRRVHHLIFSPSIESAEKFTRRLIDLGCNVSSDGRPILGLTSKEILSLMLETDESMMMVPAHAWTPWFSVFGSLGGYDSLEECFEELTPHIRAIETGLSSDPLMNWRLSALDNITLISNSDAHSCAKLGREANVMQFRSESDITYAEIRRIIQEEDRGKFLYTIEFYPEEGKYHYDGHRDCKVVWPPAETKKHKGICPVCKKPLTIGVMHRVADLANRSDEEAKHLARIPYRSLVPLPEIIADTLEVGVSTKQVKKVYDELIQKIGSEFYILLQATRKEIESASSRVIADAIERVRAGNIVVKPGYDGVFGVVKVFDEGESRGAPKQAVFSLD